MQTFWAAFGRRTDGYLYHINTTDEPRIVDSWRRDPKVVDVRAIRFTEPGNTSQSHMTEDELWKENN